MSMKDFDGIKKKYVELTFFNILPDMESGVRHTIEGIIGKTEKYGIRGVEWYKEIPVKIDDMEYNTALISIKSSDIIVPERISDDEVMKVLKQSPKVKKGDNQFCLRIDVICPFIKKNFTHYHL